MRLSDIIGAAPDLSLYPKIGLILFFAVFVTIVVRAVRRPAALTARWGAMPLDDGQVVETEADTERAADGDAGAR